MTEKTYQTPDDRPIYRLLTGKGADIAWPCNCYCIELGALCDRLCKAQPLYRRFDKHIYHGWRA